MQQAKKKPATPEQAAHKLQAACKEAVTWTQGQETSTTHLFHNWRTLINGTGKRVEPIDTGLPYLEFNSDWHNKYRAAGRTVRSSRN